MLPKMLPAIALACLLAGCACTTKPLVLPPPPPKLLPLPPELARQGLHWYPEEIDLLLHMFRQGASAEAMAAKLLRSVDLVRSRLEILGLENAP